MAFSDGGIMQQLMIEKADFSPPKEAFSEQKPKKWKSALTLDAPQAEFATFCIKTPFTDSGEMPLESDFYRVQLRRYGGAAGGWEWKPVKPVNGVCGLSWAYVKGYEPGRGGACSDLEEAFSWLQAELSPTLEALERYAVQNKESMQKRRCVDSEIRTEYVRPDGSAYSLALRLPSLLNNPEFKARFDKEEREKTTVVIRKCWYDDGSVKEFILGIENPGAVYVRKYRDNLYKVVSFILPLSPRFEEGENEKGSMEDGERFQSNLSRARTAIEEYGLCNSWKWFVTLTLDADKKDRSDLEAFRKKLNQMIRDLRRNTGENVDFLLVPELHPTALEDGRVEWHMHGLMNIPESWLELFVDRAIYGAEKNKRPPLYIQKLLRKGVKVYHWRQYDKSFGGNIVESVLNPDRAVRYLLKYVSKEQAATAAHLEKGQHLYFVSRGLKKSEKVDAQCLPNIARRSKKEFVKPAEFCLVRWISL